MVQAVQLGTSVGALLVERILHSASELGASDIHLERGDNPLRFRLDGMLREESELGRSVAPVYQEVISRLKVMAELDIAERRLPQDGRIRWHSGGTSVDIRLSLIPALSGERAVLRLIYGGNEIISLSSLGMAKEALHQLQRELKRTHGLLLVTGPTGSGKSTTLYAAMQAMSSPERCILSVEDPVERVIAGTAQVPVHAAIGLHFSQVLRAFLRQDPEVLVVGEMRDRETAEIAVRASLTGHIVLSTLHAGSGLASIARLRDMGLPGWLLGASLRLMMAQRLVRRLCASCRQPDEAGTAHARQQGWLQASTSGRQIEPHVYQKLGCEACRQSGYDGRVGIFEVLPVSSQLAAAMARGASDGELAQAAGDYEDLQSAAVRRLVAGEISLAEMHRVLG